MVEDYRKPVRQDPGVEPIFIRLGMVVGVGLFLIGAALLSEAVHWISGSIAAAGGLILLGCIRAVGWWDGVVTVATVVVCAAQVYGVFVILSLAFWFLGSLARGS